MKFGPWDQKVKIGHMLPPGDLRPSRTGGRRLREPSVPLLLGEVDGATPTQQGGLACRRVLLVNSQPVEQNKPKIVMNRRNSLFIVY